MSVFTAGIVWDPREPLPPELQSSTGTRHALFSSLTQRHVNLPARLSVPSDESLSHTPANGASILPQKMLPDGVIKESSRTLLPPTSISIEGRIIHDTASITVSQAFWNNADISIPKASYVFPLPSGCTVTSFSCRVGKDKVLRAKAKPKMEANEAFQQAIVLGHTTALLEQNTPEIFTASLGNIPPDTRLEAKLTYITLLKHQFSDERNVSTLSIPTAIANRYGNAPADITVSGSQGVPRTFTLQIEVLEARERLEIKSESHQILLDRGMNKRQPSKWEALAENSHEPTTEVAVVKLDPKVNFLHEDFVLTIKSDTSKMMTQPHAWLESHPTLENQNALMITIPSSFMAEERLSTRGEILFLVDRSGSMRDKIGAVKSSLRFFLKGIPLGRTFNIWSFGSFHVKLWSRSKTYSAESLHTAMNYVETRFNSDMGGTELLPALTALLQGRDSSCPCDIVILTDGEVWRLDETLALVQKTRIDSKGALRFFSLGIGAHVSHALVQGIASRGGGYSEVIPKASLGGWEDRLVAMLKAALTSHESTLDVKLNGETYRGFLTSPSDIGTLNLFQRNRIFVLSTSDSSLDQLTSVTIESLDSDGHQVHTAIGITRLQNQDAALNNLAARAVLDELEHSITGISIAPYGQASRSSSRMRLDETQAVDLACRFSLLSKWTSLFLQQENTRSEAERESFQTIITVSHVGGDSDLLQSRGTSRFITKWNRLRPSNESQSAFPPHDDLFDYLTTPRASTNDSRHTPLSGEWPKKRGRPKSHYHKHAAAFQSQVRPCQMSSNLQKEFVGKLLAYQNFDGSIGVSVQSLLVPSLAEAAREIQEYAVNESGAVRSLAALLAYTVIVVLSLERDFQDCEGLWDLMRTKAVGYISTQVSDEKKKDKLMEFTKGLLTSHGFALSKSGADSDEAVDDPQGPGDRTKPTLVHIAPID